MRITLFIIVTVLSLSVFSQTRIDTIFDRLPEGALLVRLKTHENTINALKGKNDQLMYKVIRKRDQENAEIVEAFKSFTLCPVYFFYSSDSRKVINRDFESVILDNNLNPLPDTLGLNENYLVATFDYTKKDTSKYYMSTEYRYVSTEVNGEYKGERKKVDVYGSTSAFNTGIDALLLLSPELVPIQSSTDVKKMKKKVGNPNMPINKEEPLKKLSVNSISIEKLDSTYRVVLIDPGDFITYYPHYVRTFEGWPFVSRPKKRTVELLQYKIERYVQEYMK